MEKKGAGLKLPVVLKIKDMPKMLDFAFKHKVVADGEPQQQLHSKSYRCNKYS